MKLEMICLFEIMLSMVIFLVMCSGFLCSGSLLFRMVIFVWEVCWISMVVIMLGFGMVL